jgi:hypothetical protein
VYQTFMVYKCSPEAAVRRLNGTRLPLGPDNQQMRALVYYQNLTDVWQVGGLAPELPASGPVVLRPARGCCARL